MPRMNWFSKAAVTAGVMALAAVGVAASTAKAADLDVLASNAIKSALAELGPSYEKSSGDKLVFSFKTAAELKADIEKGAAVDVAIITNAGIDDLIKQGKLTAANRTDVVGSAIGLAVRKGATKPDIGSADAFKATLLAAKSIGYVEQGATGVYLKQVFVKLGIADAIKGKLVLLPGENPAAKAVGNGEAEIGITQIAEILPYAATSELLGPLPGELQQVTVFTAATSARKADAGKAFIAYLKSAPAVAVMKAKGLDPR